MTTRNGCAAPGCATRCICSRSAPPCEHARRPSRARCTTRGGRTGLRVALGRQVARIHQWRRPCCGQEHEGAEAGCTGRQLGHAQRRIAVHGLVGRRCRGIRAVGWPGAGRVRSVSAAVARQRRVEQRCSGRRRLAQRLLVQRAAAVLQQRADGVHDSTAAALHPPLIRGRLESVADGPGDVAHPLGAARAAMRHVRSAGSRNADHAPCAAGDGGATDGGADEPGPADDEQQRRRRSGRQRHGAQASSRCPRAKRSAHRIDGRARAAAADLRWWRAGAGEIASGGGRRLRLSAIPTTIATRDAGRNGGDGGDARY